MKRKELAMIIGVAVVAGLFGLMLSSFLFGSPSKNPIRVPVVQPIKSTFPVVNSDDSYKTMFNEQAIDPTQLIRVGGQTNPQPFRGQ